MPRRILYVADGYESAHAGTERQLLRLLEGLDRRRYDPALVLLRSTPTSASMTFPCPMQVLGVGALRNPRTIAALARCAWSARRDGYRLVHCFFNDASVVAPVFRLFGLHVVVSRRDLGFWYTPGILAALRLGQPFVSHYVVNSEAVRDCVRRNERVPARKTSVIYNGCRETAAPAVVPAPVTMPGDRHAAAPVVGLVANLRPIKRIDVFVDALALLRRTRPQLRGIVVGADGPGPGAASLRASLLAHAARLGVADGIEFTGAVADAGPWIERFSVAVLCSESEGLSNALIEYMQAGRPIVCTRTGGNPELITDSFNGFLVPVGDAHALAACVGRLLDDPVLARRLGGAARTSVRVRCSDTRMLAEQMACYDEIVRVRPAARARSNRGQGADRC